MNKKVREHTEPLQPPTLAVFLPWGSSEGAGRAALTGHKCKTIISSLQTLRKVYHIRIHEI